jgi:hypothetical protein
MNDASQVIFSDVDVGAEKILPEIRPVKMRAESGSGHPDKATAS